MVAFPVEPVRAGLVVPSVAGFAGLISRVGLAVPILVGLVR